MRGWWLQCREAQILKLSIIPEHPIGHHCYNSYYFCFYITKTEFTFSTISHGLFLDSAIFITKPLGSRKSMEAKTLPCSHAGFSQGGKIPVHFVLGKCLTEGVVTG